MKNEEKMMEKTTKKAEKENRKVQRSADVQPTPEQTQTQQTESAVPSEREIKRRRLPKPHLPKRRGVRTPCEKGAKARRLRSWIAAHKTGVKRAAFCAIALLLTANVVLTSVFVAYSVRTRRVGESDYYSNYWEIDDLRTAMEENADALEENMDRWKTGESIYSGTIGDNLTWTIDPETAELTISGVGDMDETFDENCRPSCGMLYADFVRSIVVDSDVTSIAPYAFQGFSSLDSVTLGLNTAIIGSNAFSNCERLSEVITGAGLKEIEANAFFACNALHDLYLPEGFETYDTANTSRSCIRFEVDEGGTYSSDADGCLYKDDGKTLVSCPVGTDYNYQGEPESWSVPKNVTTIEKACFVGCHFARLTIPGSVKTLDLASFDDCTVRELTMKKGVKEIVGASAKDVYINKVVLPEGVEKVDEDLFGANIGEIDASADQTALWVDENGLVYSADRKELLYVPHTDEIEVLRIAEGTERIRDNTVNDFYWLKSIVLPSSLRVIGDDNFNSIGLGQGTTLKFPAHLTYIGDDCLCYCTVSKVTIPATVRHIGVGFMYETNDNRYDAQSDTCDARMTKVMFDGTQSQWDEAFGVLDAPERFKLVCAE